MPPPAPGAARSMGTRRTPVVLLQPHSKEEEELDCQWQSQNGCDVDATKTGQGWTSGFLLAIPLESYEARQRERRRGSRHGLTTPGLGVTFASISCAAY